MKEFHDFNGYLPGLINRFDSLVAVTLTLQFRNFKMIVYHFLLQHNTVPEEMHGLSEMSWQSFAFMIMHSCILLSFPSGNYGNKFDESVAPCNTPPVNAVYDGCYYHYLPWGQEKPCVCVECSWEDIAFRLEPINIITRMAEREVSP